ncbi:MAG: DUF305 domain-containing protein [Thermomicrobiales bacterium]
MRITTRAAAAALFSVLTLIPAGSYSTSAAQEATPAAYRCETAGTPHAGMSTMPGMPMSTPAMGAGHDMAGQTVEFDQMYIDMMLPHHASIIALAQAAQDRLTDPRLQAIAENIITSQTAENAELRGYREQWFGSAESMPLDDAMLGTMMQLLPGMGDMASMQRQMDPQALVAAFCAGVDADQAFIELTIPHHQIAIQASEAALDQATHDEIRTVAGRVIADQQREIDELEQIATDLSGEATPAA